MVLKGGSWYLVARWDGRFRTYRISRILAADVLGQGFEQAVDFDLSRFWQHYLDDYDARRYEGWAVLRLSSNGMHRVPHLAEPAVVSEVQKTAVTEPDGWTRVTVPVESHDQAVRELLLLGADVQVLAPAELRSRMAETVAAMSRHYNLGNPVGAGLGDPRAGDAGTAGPEMILRGRTSPL